MQDQNPNGVGPAQEAQTEAKPVDVRQPGQAQGQVQGQARMQRPGLNVNRVQNLAMAVTRFKELAKSSISTPEKDAEMSNLVGVIAHQFIENADELVGAWFTVKQEYEPLVNAFAALSRHANQINVRVAMANNQALAQSKTVRSPE